MGLAQHLRPFGYEISVLFLEDGPLVTTMKDAGIPSSSISWTGERGDLSGAWQAWRWLRRHRAEIAHLHHGGGVVRAVCRLAGVGAVVQHLHGRINESNGASASKLNFPAPDALIACSQAVAESVCEGRAEVIYAGIETGAHPPAAASQTGPLKLGVLARLIPLKNIEVLIEATALLAGKGIDVQAEIAGSGPSESSLRALVLSLGVSERVRFLGWNADVQRLLASWDLLVIPSLEEGFGLSALEAMAAARPVVASRVGGLCELVVDGMTGRLFPAGDTYALVRCIAEAANDRQRWALMGAVGWKRAREHFSTDLMARRTVELYDRLPDRSAHRTA